MGRSRIPHAVLRNIELEVMELRASLEPQGLHRDAIDDICDEKRQRLIEEHEASLASPARNQSENGENDDSSVDLEDLEKKINMDEAAQNQGEKGREKEKIREERTKEKEREKEKDDRAKDKDKA